MVGVYESYMARVPTYFLTETVSLTPELLVLLDGKDNGDGKLQEKVDEALHKQRFIAKYAKRLTANEASFVALVVLEAQREGELRYREMRVTDCDICGRSKYRPFDNAERTMPGVDLVYRSVTIKNMPSLGGCTVCIKRLTPILKRELSQVQAVLPKKIMGREPKFVKHEQCRCTKCRWKGHTGEMRLKEGIFGGTYPGICPKCGAENSIGTTKVKKTGGFILVPVKKTQKESV